MCYQKAFLFNMEKSKHKNEAWEQNRRITIAQAIYNGMKEVNI